ncbi:MAG: hypothetical protein A2046_02185 [Bacteroidetes bacterium GWA2_30_7]|nr:MAG: hypothetical protein A2046_02185 [Bacteroidetes bacterium GWA2_30_7]
MTTLKVLENTTQAKLFLQYAMSLPFVKLVESEHTPNKTTLKAMKDAEEGKVTRAKNVKDLIEKLNK